MIKWNHAYSLKERRFQDKEFIHFPSRQQSLCKIHIIVEISSSKRQILQRTMLGRCEYGFGLVGVGLVIVVVAVSVDCSGKLSIDSRSTDSPVTRHSSCGQTFTLDDFTSNCNGASDTSALLEPFCVMLSI